MRKNVFGRQFKRDANERKALFKNLLTSLVLEERIKTTPAKAKAIRGAADKLVTKAKKGGDEAFRALAPDVNYNAVAKLVNDIAPRFVGRQGGYTRIIRVGRRIADNAPQVLMEWVEKGTELRVESGEVKKSSKLKVKSEKLDKKESQTKKSAPKKETKEAEVKVSKEKKEAKKEKGKK